MKFVIDKKKILPVFLLGSAIILVAGLGVLFLSFGISIYRIQKQESVYAKEIPALSDILERKKNTAAGRPLTQKKDPAVLTGLLSNIALRNNVRFNSLVPAGIIEEKNNFYKQALFDMDADASFKDLGSFFDELRAVSDDIIDIDTLRMQPDKGDPARVKAKIIVSVIVGKDYGQK